MLDYKQIFDAMTSDPRYQRNLDWGEARPDRVVATQSNGHLRRKRPRLETCGGV